MASDYVAINVFVGHSTKLPYGLLASISTKDIGETSRGNRSSRNWLAMAIHQTISLASVRRRCSASHSTSLHISWTRRVASLIWQFALVVLPSGSGEHPNERAGSCEGIRIQAKVLYIDFVQSQQVCFKLTINTIDALRKHHRALCHGSFEAHVRGNVMIQEDVRILMENFERAIEHFHYHVDACCLDEMIKDRSGELTTQQSANVKSTILELFGPYESYLDTFPELLSTRLDGVLSKTSALEL